GRCTPTEATGGTDSARVCRPDHVAPDRVRVGELEAGPDFGAGPGRPIAARRPAKAPGRGAAGLDPADAAGLVRPRDRDRLPCIGRRRGGAPARGAKGQPGAGGAGAGQRVGRQVNQGLVGRVARSLFGGGGSGLRYYVLGGGSGPATASLDIGAPPGTDVYSPVDGTVVGITPYILAGKHMGARIDIQPSGNPSIVVSLTHLRPDPSLTVGSTVTATTSKVGTILDFAKIEQQALARVTQDAGNHVAIGVHAATPSLP